MIDGEGLNRYIIPLRQNEGEKEKDPDFDNNPYLIILYKIVSKNTELSVHTRSSMYRVL